jgi:branched-chain amino acid transport system ATP-binding protein
MLAFENAEVVYDGTIPALRGVSLEVSEGSLVALLGANGAGKTTMLRACTGLLPIHRGTVTRGRILLDGRRIDRAAAPEIVRAGIAQVMEGRRILAELTVEENLRLGGYTNAAFLDERFARVYDLFPVLQDRRSQRAGYLSGGEQQMLAIARALMSAPRYLLLDEPSVGLAPKLVAELRELLLRIRAEGTAILLVEQNAWLALSIAERGYVLQAGRVVLDGSSEQLRRHDDVREFYLGLRDAGGRRSFREAKHYRRRKHWAV